MGNHYLLEIGTEELPAGFLETAPGELEEKAKNLLSEEGVTFEALWVHSTPRRLVLRVDNIADVPKEKRVEQKGPPVKIALDASGQPTPAGLGFAKKMGVEFSQLQRLTVDGEEYLAHTQVTSGVHTQDLLSQKLAEMVLGLSGSHFMHWGHSTIKFSRPIRWVLSLWNNTHLPLAFDTLKSDTLSYGHRLLGESPISVSSVDEYAGLLESKGKVLVDPARRQALIWEQLQQAAKGLGGVVHENQDLLDTVTRLVEYPNVVAGRFDERFLSIPQEVIVTVMAAHQKYFPVHTSASPDADLLPHFLTVSNGRVEAKDIIAQGNERVLTARLEDARFFFEEDRKNPLAQRVEALKGVMFQKGLGSMYDKTQRVKGLTTWLSGQLSYEATLQQSCERAAELAKCDLLTGMVRELTELQGVMGKKYAQLQGEPEEVCHALFEQYLPRFTGDTLASHKAGIVLSLAEKADTMMAVFSQKNARLPSGSKDPMALRRMAYGIIQTVLENKIQMNLTALFGQAYQYLGVLATTELETAMGLVNSFVLQRLKGYLLDQQYRYDIIDAVLEAKDPLADLVDLMDRIQAVKALTQNESQFKAIYEPANRIGKILGAHYNGAATVGSIQSGCLKDPAEETLLEAIRSLPTPTCYTAQLEALIPLHSVIEAFFDKVLINDPDEDVKQNRYNLLSVLHQRYLHVARFSTLTV